MRPRHWRHLGPLVLALTVSGCAHQGQDTASTHSSVSQSRPGTTNSTLNPAETPSEQLKPGVIDAGAMTESPDLLAIRQQGDAFFAQAEKESSPAALKQALTEYEKLLAAAPEDAGLQFMLYDGYSRLLVSGDDSVELRMRELYDRLPPALKATAKPPSLSVFLFTLQRARKIDQFPDQLLRNDLLSAIQEQPADPTAYVLLADTDLQAGHYALAIATIKQAQQHAPTNDNVLRTLGRAYLLYARESECAHEHPDEIRKAAELLRSVTQKNANDWLAHQYLSDAYAMLNLLPLSVNEARLVYAQKADEAATWTLANHLSDLGHFDEADKLYQTLLEKNRAETTLALAKMAMYQGQWPKAREYFDQHFAAVKRPNFYSVLLESIVDEQLQSRDNALARFLERAPEKSLHPENPAFRWTSQLHQFRQGKLSAEMLLASAKNRCERTEANFYAGFSALNNKPLARHYFEAVLQEKAFTFDEYQLAKYFLAQP